MQSPISSTPPTPDIWHVLIVLAFLGILLAIRLYLQPMTALKPLKSRRLDRLETLALSTHDHAHLIGIHQQRFLVVTTRGAAAQVFPLTSEAQV